MLSPLGQTYKFRVPLTPLGSSEKGEGPMKPGKAGVGSSVSLTISLCEGWISTAAPANFQWLLQ